MKVERTIRQIILIAAILSTGSFITLDSPAFAADQQSNDGNIDTSTCAGPALAYAPTGATVQKPSAGLLEEVAVVDVVDPGQVVDSSSGSGWTDDSGWEN